MDTTVLDTAVIGAGAAGLLVGRRLAERGERFELFDEHARVGDSWRERYRSLRLFTPRPLLEFPGLPIDVGRFAFPTGVEPAFAWFTFTWNPTAGAVPVSKDMRKVTALGFRFEGHGLKTGRFRKVVRLSMSPSCTKPKPAFETCPTPVFIPIFR